MPSDSNCTLPEIIPKQTYLCLFFFFFSLLFFFFFNQWHYIIHIDSELLSSFPVDNTDQRYSLLLGQASGMKSSRKAFSDLSLIKSIDKMPSFGLLFFFLSLSLWLFNLLFTLGYICDTLPKRL